VAQTKHAHHKFKMAESRHIGKMEKSAYLRESLTDRQEIWHDNAV